MRNAVDSCSQVGNSQIILSYMGRNTQTYVYIHTRELDHRWCVKHEIEHDIDLIQMEQQWLLYDKEQMCWKCAVQKL